MMNLWLPLSERLSESEATRILAKVAIVGDCWHYRGATDDGGYARIWYRGRNWHGTRLIVWAVRNMVVTEGCDVAHECHNPACINPAHLAVRHLATNRRTRVAVARKLHRGGGGDWKMRQWWKQERRKLREVYRYG